MRTDIKEARADEALWLLCDTLDEISGIPFDPEEQLRKVWDHRAIAWTELVELEPRLTTLLDVIHVAIVPPGKDPAKLWYAHIRPRLKMLISAGAIMPPWSDRIPRLRRSESVPAKAFHSICW